MSSSSRSGVFGHFFSLFVVVVLRQKEAKCSIFSITRTRSSTFLYLGTCYYTVLFSSSFLSLSLSRSAFSL